MYYLKTLIVIREDYLIASFRFVPGYILWSFSNVKTCLLYFSNYTNYIKQFYSAACVDNRVA